MDKLTVLMNTEVSRLQSFIPDVPEIHPSPLLRRQSSDSLLDPLSRQSSMGSRQNSVSDPTDYTLGSVSIEMNPVNSLLFIKGERHLKDSKKKMTKVYNFLNRQFNHNDPVWTHYAPLLTLLRSSIKSLETLLGKMETTHTFDKEYSVFYMSSLVDLEKAMYTVNVPIGEQWSILTEALDDMRQADVLLEPRQADVPPRPILKIRQNTGPSSNPPSPPSPQSPPSPVTNQEHTSSNEEEYTHSKSPIKSRSPNPASNPAVNLPS